MLEQVDAADIRSYEEFDAVICILGLSVIPRWQDTIAAAHKAFKHRGRIAVVDAGLYQQFPFYLLNPFVRILHRIWKAQNRDIHSVLSRHFREVTYKEYLGGSYFLYIGQK